MKLFTAIVTILVILVIFNQVLFTKARQLRKTNGQDHLNARSTDDFTPTNPGNSPGIGHKKANTNLEGFKDDLKPTEVKKLQKTNNQEHFKIQNLNDFAPTNPGNSPGIGHKKGSANLEGFKDDSKFENKRKLRKTNNKDHFKVENVNDFAPTNPGNSPGMGHKKGNANLEGFKNDSKSLEERKLQKMNGQDHFYVENVNDFAPTNPGNSPGVGHKKGNAKIEGFRDEKKV